MHRLRAAETGDIEAMTDLLLSHGPNPWNHLPEEGVSISIVTKRTWRRRE